MSSDIVAQTLQAVDKAGGASMPRCTWRCRNRLRRSTWPPVTLITELVRQ